MSLIKNTEFIITIMFKKKRKLITQVLKIPYLIRKIQTNNKPPTVYINHMYDNTGISSPVDYGIVEPI